MNRAQYLALCIIGGIAVIAYIQSYQIAQSLRRSGMMPLQGEITI